MMVLLHLANFEDEYSKAVEKELVQQLQITEADLEEVISTKKPADTKLKPSEETGPRRSTMVSQPSRTMKALCAAGNCEHAHCRCHFEEFRSKEDPANQRRVRGKKPGRNCDVFSTLPAVIFDVDLGFKLSSCASFFIHTNPNYHDNLVYDIKCAAEDTEVIVVEAPTEDDDAPPPPSGPPPMAEWTLERKRRAPPALSGINNGTAQLSMTEEEAAELALKTVRAMEGIFTDKHPLPPHITH